jgi:hypothetical protein
VILTKLAVLEVRYQRLHPLAQLEIHHLPSVHLREDHSDEACECGRKQAILVGDERVLAKTKMV